MKYLIRLRPSNGATNLSRACGIRRNSLKKPSYVIPRHVTSVINWGNSNLSQFRLAGKQVLNKPEAVALAVNKLKSFVKWQQNGVPVPQFWSRKEEVVFGKKSIVFCRVSLAGSCGEGIVVARTPEELVDAQLYVKYIPKLYEYRIHVVAGQVILIQQKRKRTGENQDSTQALIRNHSNGWIFATENVVFPDQSTKEAAERVAIASLQALGLDFGAVDIILAKKTNEPLVLEVNTAPGIESPTLISAYKNAFANLA